MPTRKNATLVSMPLACIMFVGFAGALNASSIGVAVNLARADTIAYVGSSASAFGALDLNTGAFTLINDNSSAVDGFGVLSGSLFAGERYGPHGTLFQVNPATGAQTAIGSDTKLYYDDFGSTPTGLFAVGYDPTSVCCVQNLYSINPLTGAATLIGHLRAGTLPTCIACAGAGNVRFGGVVSGRHHRAPALCRVSDCGSGFSSPQSASLVTLGSIAAVPALRPVAYVNITHGPIVATSSPQ